MIDRNPYDDPKLYEAGLRNHYIKYLDAIERKDGYEICRNYGAMNNMIHVLQQRFGYTGEQVETIKNGQH